MPTHPLTQAREDLRNAKTDLEEKEQALTKALVEEIQEHLHQYEAGMRLTAMLIKEIPDAMSLDHAALKQKTIKGLEEMQRTLRDFLVKMDHLKEGR